MNLTQFINHVDEYAAKLTSEQLKDFIHNIARSLPEISRSDFLAKLHNIKDKQELDDEIISNIQKELQRLAKELHKINNGELCIVGNLEYCHDYGYDYDEKYSFSDPDGVIKIIDEEDNEYEMEMQAILRAAGGKRGEEL